jgi:hypothetical protein
VQRLPFDVRDSEITARAVREKNVPRQEADTISVNSSFNHELSRLMNLIAMSGTLVFTVTHAAAACEYHF